MSSTTKRSHTPRKRRGGVVQFMVKGREEAYTNVCWANTYSTIELRKR